MSVLKWNVTILVSQTQQLILNAPVTKAGDDILKTVLEKIWLEITCELSAMKCHALFLGKHILEFSLL